MKHLLAIGALTASALGTTGVAPAWAADHCQRLEVCAPDNEGILSGTRREDVTNLPEGPDVDRSRLYQPAANAPRYEYGSTTSCITGARPGDAGADVMCNGAVMACSNPANGPGPLTRIWRRTIQQGQPPSPWQLIGTTCWSDAVPGSRPVLTMAMIQDAFNHTPWAVAEISTQPAGNVTLVGLDTYYKVNWTTQGFQPNEIDAIDPARMNGYRVDIRVKLVNFMWQFGDGQTFGPTTSEGGVYPSGNITHQYLKGGAYPASVNTTFGGEFRIDGGDWAPIPDTVTVPGPTTTVTVRTAQAELVSH
jgi:hypothetical protein